MTYQSNDDLPLDESIDEIDNINEWEDGDDEIVDENDDDDDLWMDEEDEEDDYN